MSGLTAGLLASVATIFVAVVTIWGLVEEVLQFGELEIIQQTISDGVVVSTTYAEPTDAAWVDIAFILSGVVVVAAMSVSGATVAFSAFVHEEMTRRAGFSGFTFVGLAILYSVVALFSGSFAALIFMMAATVMIVAIALLMLASRPGHW